MGRTIESFGRGEMGEPMKTTWRVDKVTATEGKTEAELARVEWFKRSPAWQAMMDEYDELVESVGREEADRLTAERDDEWVDEWLPDVQPGDEGSEFFEAGQDSLTIDITGSLDLKPGDNVFLTLDAVERVPA